MLNNAQRNKLNFLTSKIQECQKCVNLCQNGMAVPYWTEYSKYMIIAESPGRNEVRKNARTPLIGKAGRLLFRFLARKKISLKREDFLILNTVQCRPVVANNKNGKPSKKESRNCRFWVEKYIEVFEPKIILAFGNYALSYFVDNNLGITRESGSVYDLPNGVKLIPCIHPASLLYGDFHKDLLIESLIIFRNEIDKIKEK